MPDGRLTLILGGARSGKSRRAEALIESLPPPRTYVATGQAFDDEMRERIEIHKARRDGRWTTVDAPLDLGGALCSMDDGRPVLIDCLTLWLSNHMLAGDDVEHETERLADVLAQPRGPWFCVSNEVGFGIVPENALARRFRDAQGRLNQRIAAIADEVILVVAGLPMKVK